MILLVDSRRWAGPVCRLVAVCPRVCAVGRPANQSPYWCFGHCEAAACCVGFGEGLSILWRRSGGDAAGWSAGAVALVALVALDVVHSRFTYVKH